MKDESLTPPFNLTPSSLGEVDIGHLGEGCRRRSRRRPLINDPAMDVYLLTAHVARHSVVTGPIFYIEQANIQLDLQ